MPWNFGGRLATKASYASRKSCVAMQICCACASASSMWVANAATITPSTDATDGRVHLTPANLISKLHRSIEPPQTARTLRATFKDPRFFVVHDPVPARGRLLEAACTPLTSLLPSAYARSPPSLSFNRFFRMRSLGLLAPPSNQPGGREYNHPRGVRPDDRTNGFPLRNPR